jgi:UDP-N-acetylglucosamine 3-dehydrogenase
MKPLRAAVIGVGNFGRKHALIYNSLDHVELVGLADNNGQRAAEVGESLKVPWFVDYRELLALTTPEIVSVVTPADRHCDPTLAALGAGAHVLVEKPIASTLEDADRMIRRAEEVDRVFMVGHLLRFDYAFRQLAEQVRHGKLGNIGYVYARRSVSTDISGLYDSCPRILTTLVHDIDAVCWILQKKPLSVSACTKSFLGSGDDLYLAVLDFGDTVASLESCWFLPAGYPSGGDARFEIIGARGMAVLKWPSDALVVSDSTRCDVVETTAWPECGGVLGGALLTEVDYFVSCVREGGKALQVPLSDARRALEIALAISAAGQSKEAITFGA